MKFPVRRYIGFSIETLSEQMAELDAIGTIEAKLIHQRIRQTVRDLEVCAKEIEAEEFKPRPWWARLWSTDKSAN